MSLKKFGRSDIIRNAMRANPHSSFLIYSSSVYYDNRPIESGEFSSDILSASGGLSLFEYNVDRSGSTIFIKDPTAEDPDIRNLLSASTALDPNPPIVPYIIKNGSMNYLKAHRRRRTLTEGSDLSFKIISGGPMQEVSDDYLNSVEGSFLTGSSYVMTSSITRELMAIAGGTASIDNIKVGAVRRPSYRHYYGLKNSLNFYGTRSPHYFVEYSASVTGQWNKDEQDINLLSIPKIFYGTRMKPGSMSLKFYITGTLVGELQDTKYNGELIQIGPVGSVGSGSVAGVAMYEEGFALLTGSWDIGSGIKYDFAGVANPANFKTASWLSFGAGANDSISAPTNSGQFSAGVSKSASFGFSFDGHTETQVLTMYAHARRGEVNYSNNPTFLDFNQTKVSVSSSNLYIENDSQTIKNTVSSSYEGFDAPFERQVYVSRIAIYDDDKKLIGIATLSNPVLKKEAQDLSFKLKLDL